MTSTSTTDGGWVPPYTSITQLISSSYSKKLEENVFKESPIMAALKREQQKAVDAIAADLERELFGSKTMKRNEGLRRIIADAYEEHTPKEAEVSTEDIVRKAVDKKKEERAENLVEYLTSFFDNGEFVDGDTIGWSTKFRNNDKVYRYAAVKSGGMWYITNRTSAFDDMAMVEVISTLAIDGTVVMDGDDEPL